MQVFDPESNSWADGAFLTTRRNGFGMVALHNGSVLAAGGYSGTVDLNSAEIMMPGVNSTLGSGATHHPSPPCLPRTPRWCDSAERCCSPLLPRAD